MCPSKYSLLCKVLIFLNYISNVKSQEAETSTNQPELHSNLQGRNKACQVLFAIDEPLFKLHNENMSVVVALAKDHISGLNKIFSEQVFVETYSDLYFNLKRVAIQYQSCESTLLEEEYDKNCTEQRENFLSAFDQSTDTSDFCLGYLMTYRDFHNGTAGLASIGTVCRPIQNTGFITLLNYKQDRSLDESIKTFAHEVAHSFNALHDNEFEENEECFNKGYIMDETYNSSYIENSGNFSECSLTAMKEKVEDLKTSIDEFCFENLEFDANFDVEISQCGNYIVEPGEQCDCGDNESDCNDPCCYPAHISRYERSLNSSAKSCQRTERYWCLNRPEIFYGFYLPWAVILIVSITILIALYVDFQKEKRFFKHITETRIRIIN